MIRAFRDEEWTKKSSDEGNGEKAIANYVDEKFAKVYDINDKVHFKGGDQLKKLFGTFENGYNEMTSQSQHDDT